MCIYIYLCVYIYFIRTEWSNEHGSRTCISSQHFQMAALTRHDNIGAWKENTINSF